MYGDPRKGARRRPGTASRRRIQVARAEGGADRDGSPVAAERRPDAGGARPPVSGRGCQQPLALQDSYFRTGKPNAAAHRADALETIRHNRALQSARQSCPAGPSPPPGRRPGRAGPRGVRPRRARPSVSGSAPGRRPWRHRGRLPPLGRGPGCANCRRAPRPPPAPPAARDARPRHRVTRIIPGSAMATHFETALRARLRHGFPDRARIARGSRRARYRDQAGALPVRAPDARSGTRLQPGVRRSRRRLRTGGGRQPAGGRLLVRDRAGGDRFGRHCAIQPRAAATRRRGLPGETGDRGGDTRSGGRPYRRPVGPSLRRGGRGLRGRSRERRLHPGGRARAHHCRSRQDRDGGRSGSRLRQDGGVLLDAEPGGGPGRRAGAARARYRRRPGVAGRSPAAGRDRGFRRAGDLAGRLSRPRSAAGAARHGDAVDPARAARQPHAHGAGDRRPGPGVAARYPARGGHAGRPLRARPGEHRHRGPAGGGAGHRISRDPDPVLDPDAPLPALARAHSLCARRPASGCGHSVRPGAARGGHGQAPRPSRQGLPQGAARGGRPARRGAGAPDPGEANPGRAAGARLPAGHHRPPGSPGIRRQAGWRSSGRSTRNS